MSQYVYICNNDDCEEMFEDETMHCYKCGANTREVHKGDMGMDYEEGDEIDEEN